MSKEETKLVDQKIHGIFIEEWQYFFTKKSENQFLGSLFLVGKKDGEKSSDH